MASTLPQLTTNSKSLCLLSALHVCLDLLRKLWITKTDKWSAGLQSVPRLYFYNSPENNLPCSYQKKDFIWEKNTFVLIGNIDDVSRGSCRNSLGCQILRNKLFQGLRSPNLAIPNARNLWTTSGATTKKLLLACTLNKVVQKEDHQKSRSRI